MDEQVTDERHRQTELRNFIEALTRIGREGLLAVDRQDTPEPARNAAEALPLAEAAAPLQVPRAFVRRAC